MAFTHVSCYEAGGANKHYRRVSQRRVQNRGRKRKSPPERPCGQQCGGLGAQSPHQTGRVFLPDADENAPGTFCGSEKDEDRRCFVPEQSFDLEKSKVP